MPKNVFFKNTESYKESQTWPLLKMIRLPLLWNLELRCDDVCCMTQRSVCRAMQGCRPGWGSSERTVLLSWPTMKFGFSLEWPQCPSSIQFYCENLLKIVAKDLGLAKKNDPTWLTTPYSFKNTLKNADLLIRWLFDPCHNDLQPVPY